MTRTTNARLAGFTFLFYITVGIASLILSSQATAGADIAAELASIAQHASLMRLTVVLTLLTFACAIILAATLYALTREEDRDLAMIAFCCRLSEGVIGAVSAVRTLQLLGVATAAAAAIGVDRATAQALGTSLLHQGSWSSNVGATCFAWGSTLYAYLFLRARTIPVPLAWLGVLASILLAALLPAEIAGLAVGRLTYLKWLPMLVFEVTFAMWLMIKGVALPQHVRT